CYDDEDRLWIGTSGGLALYNPHTDSFERISIGSLLVNNRIHAIAKKDNYLYIGTLNKGLIIYNLKNRQYTVYGCHPGSPTDIGSDYVKAILVDKADNLWIGTQGKGVSVLQKDGAVMTCYNSKNGLTNDYVRSIVEGVDGRIVLGTFNGLNVIDPRTGTIEQYRKYGSGEGLLSHYSITAAYFDKSQSLWVGTYAGGVCYYSKYGQKFSFYNPLVRESALLGVFGQIVETDNNLYFATEGGGLLEMDKQTEKFSHYDIFDDIDDVSYGKNIIKSLFYENGKMLCGTNVGTIYSFDLKTKRFTLIFDRKAEHSVYHISKSLSGDLVIGGVNQQGLIFISKDGKLRNTFPVRLQDDVSFSDIRCVLEIRKNVFLIGTRNEGLYYYDYDKQLLKNYKSNPDNTKPDGIPENYVSCIIKSSIGNIWLGTVGGGLALFDEKTGKFKTYGTKENLLNNNVCAIVEDDDKHLWISTISGISEFNPITGEFKNYTHQNGIKIDEFSSSAGLRLRNNEIIFCGNNGFTKFNPKGMSVNPYVPPVVFRNLYIDNNRIERGGKDGILKKSLEDSDELVLKYNQSNISIEYSALNYVFSDRNQYAYKLEGFDEDWNEVGSRRVAYYTNIPPGNYTFIVKGSNNDGVWNNDGVKLCIKILPPVWKTWWAYCLYVIIVALIVFFIIKYFADKKRFENDIKLKQLEAKAMAEFHEARDKLFTNFSHELRTPLTLILNPLEDMANRNDDPDPQKKKSILLMRSNARRLLRLVNNLMDFQKRESGAMTLKVIQSDIIRFSQEMISFFEELALSRNVQLIYTHNVDSLLCWFDKGLMEKVYFNFLSNAFKNVRNGGFVQVNVETIQSVALNTLVPEKYNKFCDADIPYLMLEIRDSGQGIAADELEKIFIPFYQVAQNEHSASGTGLGLSLSKAIIEMHHGIIWAESPEGSGAIFRCVLPLDKNLFKKNEIYEGVFDGEITPFEVEVKDDEPEDTDKSAKKHTILVAEDNRDVRRYIISHLEHGYNVMEASNGADAVEKAIQFLPDLVLTDLMMPRINGIELCAILKKDLRTGHIPVIMITAKTMPEDMREGYSIGADAYLTKPFSMDVLLARVANVIHSREKLKEIYSKRFSLESLGIDATSADERFMQKLYAILEKNIANPEMNLDDFCKDIGMSRANMYRKLKSITNLSPNEFIRNFRLEMGAKILKGSHLSVSEVYVAVGFNSHAYFSNCFKTLYGMSPTEYAAQHVK
ncbi:MAG: response regulator, partial [Prevotella sp.]|nr:response regulator [Prevotella sp.]